MTAAWTRAVLRRVALLAGLATVLFVLLAECLRLARGGFDATDFSPAEVLRRNADAMRVALTIAVPTALGVTWARLRRLGSVVPIFATGGGVRVARGVVVAASLGTLLALQLGSFVVDFVSEPCASSNVVAVHRTDRSFAVVLPRPVGLDAAGPVAALAFDADSLDVTPTAPPAPTVRRQGTRRPGAVAATLATLVVLIALAGYGPLLATGNRTGAACVATAFAVPATGVLHVVAPRLPFGPVVYVACAAAVAVALDRALSRRGLRRG